MATAFRPAEPDYTGYDFLIYPRQSSEKSHGNANTGVQEEDLPKLVAERFGVDRDTHPFFYVAPIEVESGADGSVRLRRTAGSGLALDNFHRTQFVDLLGLAQERYATSRVRGVSRPIILVVSEIRRLGRSNLTLPLIEAVANACHGELYIYDAGARSLLNPQNHNDNKILSLQLTFTGRGESEGKQVQVRGARARIVDTTPIRSLGEKTFGYDKVWTDLSGTPIDDPMAFIAAHKKRPPRIFVKNEDHAAVVAWIFDAVDQSEGALTQSALVLAVQRTFGDHPVHGRPWNWAMLRSILRNPMYKGYREASRTRRVSLGSTQQRPARPDEVLRARFEPALVIVDAAVYDRVQGYIGRAPRTRGRPPSIEAYSHRNRLLRCALCGAALTIL